MLFSIKMCEFVMVMLNKPTLRIKEINLYVICIVVCSVHLLAKN